VKRSVIVCLEEEPRKFANSIEVMPWRHFLDVLWSGGLGV
jgi:hypothetical protein